jgi:hypothetical protein
MNSSEIKDRASSFFARLKLYAAYAVRYIIFICRKYPFLAAIFLVFYAFFIYKYLSPDNLPIPQSTQPPIQQNTALPNSPATSTQPSSQTTTPAPVIEAAQVTAVQSGENLSIRWDRPVQDPVVHADNATLDTNCQPQTCNVILNKPADEITVRWDQDGERFIKSFKISD